MSRQYQICTRCVMDTSDPDIEFQHDGTCNHCNNYFSKMEPIWYRGKEGEIKLQELLDKIKQEGKNKEYDCIIGLSGGVDSAYLAYLCFKWKLRPLAVHVDAGWNTEMAIKNIENICNKLNIDLITEVIEWDDMKELQRAFFKSQVINQDTPQDHAFFASLYKYATKHRIKYVLNGYNISSESILPLAWRGQGAMDKTHLLSIFRKYSNKKLGNFPLMSIWSMRFFYRLFYDLKIASPLNFLDYNKGKALVTLVEEVDFIDYGGKHNESKFTKFFQSYFLPQRFGYEKRRAHLSGLIVSGQISRENALIELKKPLYQSEVEQNNDISYFCKKLGFSREEFYEIMSKAPDKHENFPNEEKLNIAFDKTSAFLKKIIGR